MSNHSLNLEGQKFGRLTAIKRIGKDKNKYLLWEFQCDCGKTVILPGSRVKSGATLSCGCLMSESVRNAYITHGMKGTRLYHVWAGMRSRCRNPESYYNRNYAGRGVSVCEEWKSFENFREWAMANGYSDDLSIDRINVNDGYSPSNCRWVDYETQCNNKRTSVYLTHNGKTQTIAQWAREKGISIVTLHARISRYGWDAERALEEPVHEEYNSRKERVS